MLLPERVYPLTPRIRHVMPMLSCLSRHTEIYGRPVREVGQQRVHADV